MENPLKYLHQPPPGPVIPISLCVVGPPKSGKSTGTESYDSEIINYSVSV